MATKLPPSTALRAMRGGGRIPHTRSDLQLTVELCRATLGEEKGRGTAGGRGGRGHWFRTRALVGRWHALGARDAHRDSVICLSLQITSRVIC